MDGQDHYHYMAVVVVVVNPCHLYLIDLDGCTLREREREIRLI
jgi:hypothetical protein